MISIAIKTQPWHCSPDSTVDINAQDYLVRIIRDGLSDECDQHLEAQLERIRATVAKTLVLLRESKLISDEQMFDAAGLDEWGRSHSEDQPVVKE